MIVEKFSKFMSAIVLSLNLAGEYYRAILIPTAMILDERYEAIPGHGLIAEADLSCPCRANLLNDPHPVPVPIRNNLFEHLAFESGSLEGF